jgi:hypothetical protein
MGARGREIVTGKFSSEYHLRNTLELYDELLSNKSTGNVRLGQVQESL